MTQEDAKKSDSINNMVALIMAALAMFLAFSAIKASNDKQLMEQAQDERTNSWSWYQAVRTREDMAAYELSHLQRLARISRDPVEVEQLNIAVTEQDAHLEHIRVRLAETQTRAMESEAAVGALSVFDDQYDISNAIISIALSLLAVCVVGRTRWLLAFSMLPATAGVFVGAMAMAHVPLPMYVLMDWLN